MEGGKVNPKPVSLGICMAFAWLVLFPALASSVSSYDVIVVRGDMPTDYIVASIYASTKKIPLVLVDPDNIQEPIRSELIGYTGRGYQLLLIIGGKSAISSNVENDLKSMGFTVNRLWDWNRYGTAARVSIDLWGEADQVVITNGEEYSGFLLAQLTALERGAPILFIQNRTVPMETSDALKKLGTTSVILISSDARASDSLRSLGVSVETIETISSGGVASESPGPDLLLYAFLSILLVMIILLSVGLRKRVRPPVFILTEDEEKMVEMLRIHGKTDQSRLAKLTDFSKPRISRMLRSLEERGIIEREKFKKTFKIKLKRKIS
jgi:hypothetical protein